MSNDVDRARAYERLNELDAALTVADDYEPDDTVAAHRSMMARKHARAAEREWRKRRYGAAEKEAQIAIDYLEGNR